MRCTGASSSGLMNAVCLDPSPHQRSYQGLYQGCARLTSIVGRSRVEKMEEVGSLEPGAVRSWCGEVAGEGPGPR